MRFRKRSFSVKLLCLSIYFILFLILIRIIIYSYQRPSKTSKPVVIWSNDYHISPIRDLKYLLTPNFRVQFIDKSLSSYCSQTHTCRHNLKFFTPENGMDPPVDIRQQFLQHYKYDTEMSRVNAFICFHPSAMCEVFMPFNKSLIIIATTRYELGRHESHRWHEWNKNLKIIAQNTTNVIAANNLYDAEYIRYFTGLNITVLPSLCDYTSMVYHPTSKNILIAPIHNEQFFTLFSLSLNDSLKRLHSSIEIVPVRTLYKNKYQYFQLIRHPAIIHIPYQVSTMSLFEQYRMQIPLFFPTIDLLTEWHLKYRIVSERTWDNPARKMSRIKGVLKNVPDPNNEFDGEAVRYWLKYADFYQWPNIIYFNSTDDLIWKLSNTNLTHVSLQMKSYNRQVKEEVLQKWKVILDRIKGN
ncbi:unnamed protein product [Didymodactylos carnosus]|uniref:Glycosyltransferase n=1 Tax=Didymodactylos carnosus TaxID=1234261 RepID=A0A813T6K6_9BILA|nr:unnamed protein product [Didymodactylos carnosus]CAF1109785.1 unnamed protein product [Didymodactylos carnosus]CAF3595184.1 unnamed protein product [Didymodactylos carnosus]CAF3876410.1 unnamed protein product [Didymodactylos carnosus]